MEPVFNRINEQKFKLDEAGAFLGGISKVTIWRMVRNGRLGHYRIGNKIFVGASHIEDYLRANDRAAQTGVAVAA